MSTATLTSRMHTAPGHAEEGHHDGMICLSEWKSFFDWCVANGDADMHLAQAEEAAVELKKFNARVEAAFKAMKQGQEIRAALQRNRHAGKQERETVAAGRLPLPATWM